MCSTCYWEKNVCFIILGIVNQFKFLQIDLIEDFRIWIFILALIVSQTVYKHYMTVLKKKIVV